MSIGPFQILVIALVLLVLFGRGRVSDTLGDFGKGVRAFRSGLHDNEQSEPVAVEGPAPDASASAAFANQADK